MPTATYTVYSIGQPDQNVTINTTPLLGVSNPSGAAPSGGSGTSLTAATLIATLVTAMPLLPTSLPSTPGQPWNNGGVLSFS